LPSDGRLDLAPQAIGDLTLLLHLAQQLLSLFLRQASLLTCAGETVHACKVFARCHRIQAQGARHRPPRRLLSLARPGLGHSLSKLSRGSFSVNRRTGCHQGCQVSLSASSGEGLCRLSVQSLSGRLHQPGVQTAVRTYRRLPTRLHLDGCLMGGAQHGVRLFLVMTAHGAYGCL
jgi:hypothetical protein